MQLSGTDFSSKLLLNRPSFKHLRDYSILFAIAKYGFKEFLVLA